MSIQTVINLGQWTLRSTGQTTWKVRGPEGNFTLHEISPTRWRFVYGRPTDRSQKRKKIDASGVLEAATKSIENIFSASLPDQKEWNIAEVLGEWWQTVRCEPYHKSTLKKHGNYFLEWCIQEKIYYWTDLIDQKRPQNYIDYLVEKKLKPKTISHYLDPVRKASTWIEEKTKGQIRNFYGNYRLPRNIGESLVYEPGKQRSYLPIQSVVQFIDFLKFSHCPDEIIIGVALQGLCGLQLLEALRLTWDRYSEKEGTITIEEDRRLDPQTRGVKNKYRVRRIPIPELVKSLLKSLYDSIQPSGPDLVVGHEMKPYSKKVSRLLRKYDPNISLPASDLRNTLATVAVNDKWDMFEFRKYFGHAPASTLERNYWATQTATGTGEEFIEVLRVKVVSKVEEEIEKALANTV